MLRPILSIFVAASLAACAIVPSNPQSATLTQEKLTVFFGNGINCYGPRTETNATPEGWTGTLQDCPQAYDYEVVMLPGTNPVRFILVEVFGAMGGRGLFAPLATVRITRPDGTVFEFTSPPPVDEDSTEKTDEPV